MKKAFFVLLCFLTALAGCFSMNSVTSSVTDFMVDHVPMSEKSKELAQARSDLAKVQLKISKTKVIIISNQDFAAVLTGPEVPAVV